MEIYWKKKIYIKGKDNKWYIRINVIKDVCGFYVENYKIYVK